MNMGLYFAGVVSAAISGAMVGAGYYGFAAYFGLIAIGAWLSGIAMAIKQSKR